jgi:adenylate kinase family enzyme
METKFLARIPNQDPALMNEPRPGYGPGMHVMYFVIGASGSGKTSAVHELETMNLTGLKVFFFDSIGVPSEREMIEKWTSGEGWQRAMTIEWVKRMKEELANCDVLLDGQTRPSFIAEACEINHVTSGKVILIDCSDEVRKARLLQRGQPELANEQMMQWAKYLTRETTKFSGEIISNDNLSIIETAAALAAIIGKYRRVPKEI